jgi:HSP20 family molecular chaperone IbpA
MNCLKNKEENMLVKQNRKSELSPTLKSFDEMFSNMLMSFDPFYSLELPTESRNFGRMELEMKDDEIIAKLPLPGCKHDKIDVRLENDILTVSAQKGCCCCKDEEIKHKLIRHERHYESFEESVKLPVAVDPKKTEAHYKHGVLTVKMVKSSTEKDSVHVVKVN